ncbi:MAG: hypothetical protein IK078_05535, partial [Lachnospiraceae bacterium]|nr:hypothetical protein [Lachnospiraceae bacterium]
PEKEEKKEEQPKAATYFKRGVYVWYEAKEKNPSMDHFYVFANDGMGNTASGDEEEGEPFGCVQMEGKILFHFGTSSIGEKNFTVSSFEDDIIKGYFDDDKVALVFEPVKDADPDTFDAHAYLGLEPTVETLTYEDENGWRISYYKDSFDIEKKDGVVTFVYIGKEAEANANMMKVYYQEKKKPDEVMDALKKSWGDKAKQSKDTFPGTDDVNCLRLSLPVADDKSGKYMEAIVRDYLDGTLVFEMTGRITGDDEVDTAVSDHLAMLIDSVEFFEVEQEETVEEHAAATDFENCDTFTDVVDRLGDGKGYATVKMGDTDILLVSSGTYDNDGVTAAIDGELFAYSENGIAYFGYVSAAGTAYPLAMKDNILYVCTGHSVRKYTIAASRLSLVEEAGEFFEGDGGEATYYYTDADGKSVTDMDQAQMKGILEGLFAEYESAQVVEFSAVSR